MTTILYSSYSGKFYLPRRRWMVFDPAIDNFDDTAPSAPLHYPRPATSVSRARTEGRSSRKTAPLRIRDGWFFSRLTDRRGGFLLINLSVILITRRLGLPATLRSRAILGAGQLIRIAVRPARARIIPESTEVDQSQSRDGVNRSSRFDTGRKPFVIITRDGPQSFRSLPGGSAPTGACHLSSIRV